MIKTSFRAAAVQTIAKLGDIDENIKTLIHYTKEAVKQGAELIVFPECMDTAYLFDSKEHCQELAEVIDNGPFLKAMSELAKEHKIYLASGFTEWDPEKKKIFNSGIMFDRNGEISCHYQKQFLATHDFNWFSIGEEGCPVVDTDLGRIGLAICFDGRIPEIFRILSLKGADIIVDMANFFEMDQADMWGPARAYENGVWLVAATKAGIERSIYYPGGSMIASPSGSVVAKVENDAHGIAVADIRIDQEFDKRIYTKNHKFKDRLPHTYGALVQPYDASEVSKFGKIAVRPDDAFIKVAAIQMHATTMTSVSDVIELLDHSAKLGIQCMLLPEYAFSTQYVPEAAEANRIASQSGELLQLVGEICRHYECFVAIPTVENDGETLYSTTYLIGPSGEVGRYRKVHLTFEESLWAKPGGEFPIFEVGNARIGIMSGYDGMFPETSRCLAINGADILLWPAAMREAEERRLLAVPRAEDNRVAVVIANRVDCPYSGGSFVIPPDGFPRWDVNQMAPRARELGRVMPKYVNLASCRHKCMIPKVDMFANRLVDGYDALILANQPSQ